MNYHLNRNGQHLGIFSLEELRQRRMAGEMTGNELVWRAGMPNWQSLDVILQQTTPGTTPPPIPASARKSNLRVPVVVLVCLGLLCLFILGWFGRFAIQRAGMVFGQFNQVQKRSHGHDSAVAVASQPVVVSSNSLTASGVLKRGREFRIRQYVEGYQARGERNPATDALALGLLENWIAKNFKGAMNTNLPPLNELADELAANPACTDPLVLLVAGVNCVELHESINRLERAMKGFENSRHLGYPKFYAAVILGNEVFNHRELRLPELDREGLRHFREAMTDGSIRPEDQYALAELFVSDWAKSFFDRNPDGVINIIKERGPAFAWLALSLEGQRQINDAWRARGNGYANSVTSEGWRLFNAHLRSARTALTRAWQLQTNQPLAPCRMMTVALGNSDLNEMRTWFDRSVAAQIDYAAAWNEMRWGLRPRWYGNEAAMLAFGETALNTHRFDTDAPWNYFQSVNDVRAEEELPAGERIYGRADIWPNLQEMYEGYLAATDGDVQRGWRSAYSVVAYLAGKTGVAREQLTRLNWQPDHASLMEWNRDLSLMAPETAARTGAQAAEVGEAEADRTANDFAGALKIYHELANTNLEPPARIFVNERLASLETERLLATGAWVDFLPATTNLTGWQVERGRCQVLPDGALEVRSDENGHMLYNRARMGTSFEVRGQFELVQSSDHQFQGGLVMGVPQCETQDWYAFRVKRTTAEGDQASFSEGWSRRQAGVPAVINPGTNSFWFSFQDGRATASVNGREVLDKATLQGIYVSKNQFRLGLGAFNNSDKTVIRYRNVQVHQFGKF